MKLIVAQVKTSRVLRGKSIWEDGVPTQEDLTKLQPSQWQQPYCVEFSRVGKKGLFVAWISKKKGT